MMQDEQQLKTAALAKQSINMANAEAALTKLGTEVHTALYAVKSNLKRVQAQLASANCACKHGICLSKKALLQKREEMRQLREKETHLQSTIVDLTLEHKSRAKPLRTRLRREQDYLRVVSHDMVELLRQQHKEHMRQMVNLRAKKQRTIAVDNRWYKEEEELRIKERMLFFRTSANEKLMNTDSGFAAMQVELEALRAEVRVLVVARTLCKDDVTVLHRDISNANVADDALLARMKPLNVRIAQGGAWTTAKIESVRRAYEGSDKGSDKDMAAAVADVRKEISPDASLQ
jgi:hypothetical protein